MNIDNFIKTAAVLPIGEASARPGKIGQKTEGVTNSNTRDDSVQLSTQLQNIEKNLASGEVFNAARVEEIKKAITDGHFVVNPDKVADGLLDTVRDLIQTKQT
ncbi:MAG: flagellar biosynthesis anti-sigma factor FlgM [Nitrosospira sp.]|nr:flagellar biosynthesis anti-sigma factor FlgM [Nitrosospira sp.]